MLAAPPWTRTVTDRTHGAEGLPARQEVLSDNSCLRRLRGANLNASQSRNLIREDVDNRQSERRIGSHAFTEFRRRHHAYLGIRHRSCCKAVVSIAHRRRQAQQTMLCRDTCNLAGIVSCRKRNSALDDHKYSPGRVTLAEQRRQPRHGLYLAKTLQHGTDFRRRCKRPRGFCVYCFYSSHRNQPFSR